MPEKQKFNLSFTLYIREYSLFRAPEPSFSENQVQVEPIYRGGISQKEHNSSLKQKVETKKMKKGKPLNLFRTNP
jgi:hypothetical protein